MKTTEKILIAVAWPYVNGDIHVGHLAGYLLPCDIFARWARLKGSEVVMVSGSDCHGTPITVEADKRGVSPQDIIDEYDPKVRELIKQYNISYDIFTTTTTENHREVTYDIFLNLLKNGYIAKQTSQQYYSPQEDKFLPDRYVEGECPYCHSKEQRADQCESCGRMLDMGELIDPRSKLSKSEVILKETEHYYIDFSKLQNDIKDYAQGYEGKWREWVWKETMGWINEGLRPRAITRDLDWGFEIPVDEIKKINPDLVIDNTEHKRFYVWFDAVIGYVSATVEWSRANGKNWEDFWRNPDCKHYYFMGKDNLAFHTIFWPGQLIGQKSGYNLPYLPVINQFLNLEGKKFSKSRGIYIDARKVATHFGVDSIRFYISSVLPESKDSNWKWDEFKDTINGELVGNLGNFIHRTLVFYKNKLEGNISAANTEVDSTVEEEIIYIYEMVNEDLEKCNLVSALNRILKLSKFGNQYFDQQKPWVAVKENRAECEKVIYNCLQIVYTLRSLITPYLPEGAERLEKLLGLEHLDSNAGVVNSQDLFDQFQFDKLDINKINLSETIEPLFQKVEPEYIEEFTNSK